MLLLLKAAIISAQIAGVSKLKSRQQKSDMRQFYDQPSESDTSTDAARVFENLA